MQRLRNASLALACALTATTAVATHRTPTESTEIDNSLSNRSINWNWNHNANRNLNRNTNVEIQKQHQNVHNSGNNTGNSTAQGNVTTVQGDTFQAPPRAPVASAIAPALTSGSDTCMGSSSIGAQGVGLGMSFGSTWTDDNCVMLKNSTMLWNIGKPEAAIALLCGNPQIRKALEASGTECPSGRKPQAQAASVAPAAPAVVPVAPEPAAYHDELPMSARNRKDKG